MHLLIGQLPAGWRAWPVSAHSLLTDWGYRATLWRDQLSQIIVTGLCSSHWWLIWHVAIILVHSWSTAAVIWQAVILQQPTNDCNHSTPSSILTSLGMLIPMIFSVPNSGQKQVSTKLLGSMLSSIEVETSNKITTDVDDTTLSTLYTIREDRQASCRETQVTTCWITISVISRV